MSFFKKNKKKLLIIIPLSFFFAIIYSFIFHFIFTISVILSLVLGPKFSIGNIEFKEKNKIFVENVSLKYKNQEIIKTPKMIIEYDLENKFSNILKKITVLGGKAIIIRKNESINFVDAFAGANENSKVKSGTKVPIELIEAKNVDVTFRDLSYKEPIEIEIFSTNGYVSFDKEKGIDLLFQGKTHNEEEAFYSFNNYEKKYSMTIKAQNIELNTNNMQFAYYSEDLEYSKGKGNINLTIDSDGLFGIVNFKELDIKYLAFSELAKDTNGKIEFLGNRINIDANFNIFNKKRKVLMDYDFENDLIIKIPLEKMTYAEVAHYKLLEDLNLNLNLNKYNFDNVDITLKLDKKQEFSATIDFKISDILEKNITLKNNLGKLIYTNESVDIKLLNSDLELSSFKKKLNFSLNIKDKKGNFKYYLDDFTGDGDIFFEENYLGINQKSGFMIFDSKYMYENKNYTLESNLDKEESFKLVYDFKNKILKKIGGKTKFDFFGNLVGELSIEGKNNEGEIKNLKLFNKDKKLNFELNGKFDLKDLKYNFKFKTHNFLFEKIVKEKKLGIRHSLFGSLKGEKRNMILDIEGLLEEIRYGELKASGTKISLRLKKNILEILDFSNNFMRIYGKYNIINNKLDFKFNINDLFSEKIGLKDMKFNILESVGDIKGELNNPKINLKISKAYVEMPNKEKMNIQLNSKMTLSEINIEELQINENNKFRGKYKIKESSYWMKGHILEKDFSKYIEDKNFKYRVIGLVDIKGIGKKIEIYSDFSIDNIYYKGTDLPKIKGKISYQSNKLINGILSLKEINIFKENYRIATLRGDINLENGIMNLGISEKGIELKKIGISEVLEGSVDLKAKIEGAISDPLYSISLNSSSFGIREIKFENMITKITGNKEQIKLDLFKTNYLENTFSSSGNFSLKDEKYNLQLISPKIKLDFLDLFLKKYEINEIKGEAEFNLSISNTGNNGVFKGEKISFNSEKYGIKGENLNFNFSLKGNKFNIDKFKGTINDGSAQIEGDMIIPTIVEVRKNPFFYKELKYNIKVIAKNIDYKFKDYMSFIVSTELNLNANKIIGKLEIKKGIIEKILGVSDGFDLFGIIKKFLLNKFSSNRDTMKNLTLDSEENIKLLTKDLEVNIDFKIIEGIKLDILSVVNIVEDIEGKILGQGKLSGKDEKINFLGEFEINNGRFTLNGNDFKVSSALLLFNKNYDYFPEVNPTLIFDSSTRMVSDNMEISLSGEMENLNFRIKANGESSSGSLNSFLYSEEDSQKTNASTLILRNLIDSQISNTLLGPVSKRIKKWFGLSKLKISSEFNSLPSESTTNERTSKKSNSNFALGAKIQIEDFIYKEKLYWIADAKISSSGVKESDIESSNSNRDSTDKYRIGLEYRFKEGRSIGIGGESKINQESGIQNKKTSNDQSINYYIDFKMEKKYDSIREIFKNIF
ncbi:MAG: hypothetical protein ACRC6K_07435 [Fusobacteriaceae bacterium]